MRHLERLLKKNKMNECIFCNAECEEFVCKECANKEFKEFWKIEEYSKAIKEEFPELIIIEDIAQAWNIQENELGIGKYSDYVVTSFGISKALSYDQAGAIFYNKDIRQYFDFHDK